MLKLKLHYFGPLIQRTDSLEKTLMLGKIEGGRRGQERMEMGMGVGDEFQTVHGQHGLQGHNGPELSTAPADSVPTPQCTQHSCRAPSSPGVPGLLAPGCLPHNPTLAC